MLIRSGIFRCVPSVSVYSVYFGVFRQFIISLYCDTNVLLQSYVTISITSVYCVWLFNKPLSKANSNNRKTPFSCRTFEENFRISNICFVSCCCSAFGYLVYIWLGVCTCLLLHLRLFKCIQHTVVIVRKLHIEQWQVHAEPPILH